MKKLNQLKNKLKTINKINILNSEEEEKIGNYFFVEGFDYDLIISFELENNFKAYISIYQNKNGRIKTGVLNKALKGNKKKRLSSLEKKRLEMILKNNLIEQAI